MKEYYVNIIFDIPEIDNYLKSVNKCQTVHQAILSIEPGHEIELKVYFIPNTYLSHKVGVWLQEQKESKILGRIIKFDKAFDDRDDLSNIDFTVCTKIGTEESPIFVDGDLQYFKIKFDKIRLIFSNPEKDDKSIFSSDFYLNTNSKDIINEFYSYNGFITNGKIWEAKSSFDFLKFGNVEIKFDFKFYTENDENNHSTSIHKLPRLIINHNNLGEDEIYQYGKLICSILSFYSNNKIDFTHFIHREKDNLIVISQIADKYFKKRIDKLFFIGYNGSFIDLLKNAQVVDLINKLDHFSKFINYYNLTFNLDGESKFMILYNLMEQIRNLYVDYNLITQKYKFTESVNKTDKIIRDTLRKIAEIVDENLIQSIGISEREFFKQNVICHTETIKLLPMKNQFEKLFDLMNIDLLTFNLDMGKIKALRDQIFHGNSIDIQNEEFKNALIQLPILVGILLMKMIIPNYKQKFTK